ncbi:Uncharacterised protein [Leclercia adecarboxylata]|uniref:Uncharacterized protein n=1 Tax=Leclercia adecarboxylata TaxID=83655 RepID=A0A4V6JH67_9ENTR|nr:Uncharacterised protein [Leclercia adecarboxylata]
MDAVLPTPVFARKNIVFASATLCCLLWGSSYPAIKSGYELFQIATNDIFVKGGLCRLSLCVCRPAIAAVSPCPAQADWPTQSTGSLGS